MEQTRYGRRSIRLPRISPSLRDDLDSIGHSDYSSLDSSPTLLAGDGPRLEIFVERQRYAEEKKQRWNAESEERQRRIIREVEKSPSLLRFDDLEDGRISPIALSTRFNIPDHEDEDIFKVYSVAQEPQKDTEKLDKPLLLKSDSAASTSQIDTRGSDYFLHQQVKEVIEPQKVAGQHSFSSSSILQQHQASTVTSKPSVPFLFAAGSINQPTISVTQPVNASSKVESGFVETKALPAQDGASSSKTAFVDVKSEQASAIKFEATLPVSKPAAPSSAPDFFKLKYERYHAKFLAAKAAFPTIESDPSFKTLKSAVLFASSNPVTICSANSPNEIIEPYRKAFFLLRGKEVETPNLRFTITDHPEIIHYVRFNMAKKFVDLAAKQIEETNEKKIFALATLITELWGCDPDLGEIFLACLYEELPILVPYYGKSSIKTSGNVELELKRISALTKFHAAIMQTDRKVLLRRLFPNKPFEGRNPHGPEAAWEFFAGILNSEIQVATTVIVIGSFLRICGWMMQRTYGKQFSKMIVCISRNVLPKIREKTPKEFIGPVERLAMLLEEYHRTQMFVVPENRLSEEFWFG